MSPARRLPDARRAASAAFAVLVVAVPVALLARLPVWTLAAIAAFLSVALWLVGSLRSSPRVRTAARSGASGLLAAAMILSAIHGSGLLEPFYRREGWLLLEVTTHVEPLSVGPGDTLTYSLSTTNTGTRSALGRRFTVDGVPHTGLLLYGLLPDLDHAYFLLSGPPTAALSAPADSPSERPAACTVVHADPDLNLNPAYWDWSTTYQPGWKVVGAVTGDDRTDRDLAAGETLTLTYRVTVPADHPAGRVHHLRSSLSYRDPQWATYSTHDLWFRFEQIVTVVTGHDE